MKITIASTMTANQERFMRVPPRVVVGLCKCGRSVEVLTYGSRADLEGTTLKCEVCRQ